MSKNAVSAENEIKAAEGRGYASGYQAGRRWQRSDRDAERAATEERAFRDLAFLAALQGLISTSQKWSKGKREYTTRDDKVELAWGFANEAVRQRRNQ